MVFIALYKNYLGNMYNVNILMPIAYIPIIYNNNNLINVFAIFYFISFFLRKAFTQF